MHVECVIHITYFIMINGNSCILSSIEIGEPRDLEGEEGQEEAMVRALQGAGIPSLLSLSVNAPGAQMAAVPRMPAVAAVAAGAPALAASGGVTGLALGPPGAPFQALRFGLQPQPPLFAIPPGINVGAAPFAGRGRGFRSRPSGSVSLFIYS